MFPRVTNQPLHIFRVFGNHDPERSNLKDTGVRAVQSPTEVVKEGLSFNNSPKVVEKILALLFVHRIQVTRFFLSEVPNLLLFDRIRVSPAGVVPDGSARQRLIQRANENCSG